MDLGRRRLRRRRRRLRGHALGLGAQKSREEELGREQELGREEELGSGFGAQNSRDEELAGLRGELFGDAFSIDDFRRLVNDWRGLRSELALPGCGRLAALVNRGPEFTAFLADAGHAAFLEAGDAIYLPNHGLERTAMHSVFHAGSHTGLGLSLALRRTPGEGVQDRDVGP